MPTLQKTFNYAGDALTAPLKSVNIAFDLPVYEYFATDAGEGPVDRKPKDIQTATLEEAIDANEYRVALGEEFAIGKDEPTFSLFKRFFLQVQQEGRVDDLIVTAGVRYLSDDGHQLAEQSLQFIHFPKLEIEAVSVETTKNLEIAKNRVPGAAANPSKRRSSQSTRRPSCSCTRNWPHFRWSSTSSLSL